MKNTEAKVLECLHFEEVTIKDVPRLTRALRNMCVHSCDFSVGGVIIWKDYFKYQLAEYYGSLFLKGIDPSTGTLLYYPPIGDIDTSLAKLIISDDAEGEKAAMLDYADDYLKDGESSLNHLIINASNRIRDWDEYVYDIKQFETFSGKKMEKKRNHLNYFKREYADAEISELKSDDIEELIEFTHEQAQYHDSDSLFCFDIEHSRELLEDMDYTRMFGKVIRYKGKMIGYSFGEVIGGMLFDHVEKGDITFRGVYQALASEMAKEGSSRGALWVNREDDMGDENLRKNKLSYHPAMMVRKRLIEIC